MDVKINEKTITAERVKAPKAYSCALHNDDITTMDFVVMAICKVFNKSSYDSAKIMTYIHNHGKAKIGTFCYDIAVSKKTEMDRLAREHGFPLITTVEEAD